MNWNEIQDKYPKSYESYLNWNCAKSPDCPSVECYQASDRDLYDFFDEEGIYIEILIDRTMEAKFCYSIYTYNKYDEIEWTNKLNQNYSDLEYTRKKAETRAFLKAFEILENTGQ